MNLYDLWCKTHAAVAERQRWRDATTFADLCELSALYCEGKLWETPDYVGPRDGETKRIAAELAHANRQGFLTVSSQPGMRRRNYQQRAAVEGWASEATAWALFKLALPTRLAVQVAWSRPEITDPGNAPAAVTRERGDDGGMGRVHLFRRRARTGRVRRLRAARPDRRDVLRHGIRP